MFRDHTECCARNGVTTTLAGPKCLMFCDQRIGEYFLKLHEIKGLYYHMKKDLKIFLLRYFIPKDYFGFTSYILPNAHYLNNWNFQPFVLLSPLKYESNFFSKLTTKSNSSIYLIFRNFQKKVLCLQTICYRMFYR